nr:M23 family metallopeptidase [Actinospica robiniae]
MTAGPGARTPVAPAPAPRPAPPPTPSPATAAPTTPPLTTVPTPTPPSPPPRPLPPAPLPPTPPTTPPPPTILRPFAPPRHRWNSGHRGIDLAGYPGEPVLAANVGTVLYAGFLVDRPVVVVGHGELRTTYEPVLADPSLRVGAQVSRGERLGILLAGHCAGVACLHWGLVSGRGHGDVYYDPLLLLGCGTVRLEPDDPSGGAGNPVRATPRTG